MKHTKFEYIYKVVNHGLPVLLLGEAGTGKSTICEQVAEKLGRQFSAIGLTKQTSKNDIIGFISINGNYIASQFRKAYEEGHLFLLDELDAADPNVLLVLNTLENGYIAFPDGIVHGHKDFRLVATANPQNEHSIYTGRSKLDFSTLNRYYKIALDRDSKLEEKLTSKAIAAKVDSARTFLKTQGSSIVVTMRDTIRISQLTDLGLDENPLIEVIFSNDQSLVEIYKEKEEELIKEAEEKRKQEEADKASQHEVNNFDELYSKIQEGK